MTMKSIPGAEAKRPIVSIATPETVAIPETLEMAPVAPASEILVTVAAAEQALATARQAALILSDVVEAMQEGARRLKELEEGDDTIS